MQTNSDEDYFMQVPKDQFLENNLEYINLFIEKADELSKFSYFEKGDSIITCTISKDKNGNDKIDFTYPNNEQKKAVLLLLRMFWQTNDLIYYRKFLDFYQFMPFSNKWKIEVRDIFSILDFQLDSLAFEGKKSITRKQLFEIFLYGNEGHLSKRKKYKELVYNEFAKLLNESTFHETILDFSVAVISLANISRRELAKIG